MRQLTRWPRLLVRWAKVLAGKSYYHQPQHLGKAFVPNELAGYFNDLTAKTRWPGHTDGEGVPINALDDGRRVYFVTTIVQKALGHWDKWLLTQDDTDRKIFLKLCRWLLLRQDGHGGWPFWSELGIRISSPYSAMTQGECISAFVRAWQLTGDPEFAEGAKRALELMRMPIGEGGPMIADDKGLFLEEMPADPRSSILNGWIFAIFGVYDFWLAFKDESALDLFEISLVSLKSHLQDYDVGYWSRYDVQGHLASSFYHDLHIQQLTAVSMIDDDPLFSEFRELWIQYKRSRKNRIRALVSNLSSPKFRHITSQDNDSLCAVGTMSNLEKQDT
jgi:hypothetical protein